MKSRKLVELLLYVICSPVAIIVIAIGLGFLVFTFVHARVTDNRDKLLSIIVGCAGEAMWLGLLLFIMRYFGLSA